MPSDAARERLGPLPEQCRARAPEHQERRRSVGPIREHPQRPEQVGAMLNLVDHDEAPEAAERQLGIGKSGHVGVAFEVEERGFRPTLSERTSECGLPDLARPPEPDHGKLLREPGKGNFVAGALHILEIITGPNCFSRNFMGTRTVPASAPPSR